MDERQALSAFGALSQETRLQLVRACWSLPARMASRQVRSRSRSEVSPSNISFHLKELERAGLVTQQRESRSIIYSAELRRAGRPDPLPDGGLLHRPSSDLRAGCRRRRMLCTCHERGMQ